MLNGAKISNYQIQKWLVDKLANFRKKKEKYPRENILFSLGFLKPVIYTLGQG